MLCPLLDSKASGGKQRKTAAALEERACPEAATDKAKRVKFETRQIFRYDNHDFQTIGKFCEFAKPCITSTKSPGRIRLEKYRDSRSFQRVDTLWLAVNHRQLHKLYAEVGYTDLVGDLRAKLDSDFEDRRCAEYHGDHSLLYAVQVLQEISGSQVTYPLITSLAA